MSEILGRLRKSAAQELLITLEVLRPGHEYLDFRIWVAVEAGRPGAEVETTRGFRLDIELLPELIGILTEVELGLKARKAKP